MAEINKQVGFSLKSFDGFSKFLRRESTLAHLFDHNKPILKEAIFRFVDDSHASLANLRKNMIASLEQVIGPEKLSESAEC